MVLYSIGNRIMKTSNYSVLFFWASKFLLSPILLWPETRNNRVQKCVIFCIMVALVAFVSSGIIFYIYENMHDINKSTFAIANLAWTIMAIYKLCFLWYKSDDLIKLMDHIMLNFWPYDIIEKENLTYVLDAYRNGSIFSVFLISLGISFGASAALVPIFSTKLTLPFISEYPFDWTVSPVYEILYVINGILSYIPELLGVVGFDLIILGFLLSTTYQFCILRVCFMEFNTDGMVDVIKKLRIIQADKLNPKFTKTLREVLSIMELCQLTVTVFAVCLGTYRLSNMEGATTVDVVYNLGYMIGFLAQLSIDCFLGTLLYHQASLLPDTIFQCNWINLENKQFKKDIGFVIQHAQRIPQFSAYNLFDMNMLSFVKVLKLGFSCYTLLCSMERK